MANFTPTTNPMSIAAVGTCAASRPFLAKRIDWVGPTAIGGTALIADLNGNVLAQGESSVVSQTVNLWSGPQKLTLPGKSGQAASWQVSTLSSGFLLIWF